MIHVSQPMEELLEHLEAVADAAASSMRRGALTDFECCRRQPKPREQWKFLGREQHWGYMYLVWVRADGKRWARVQL